MSFIKVNELKLPQVELFSFYFFLYTKEENIGFAKVFDFRFSMDLHVLRYLEHDLTIFRKCVSVCLYYFVDTVSQELIGEIVET